MAWSYGGFIFVHGYNDANKLEILLAIGLMMDRGGLTIPLAKYHAIMVSGNATMYLTLRVKFNSNKKLPKKPQPKDMAFKITSLYITL